MRFLRRLFGLDFPDPEAGQVWRSRHSGRAFRVDQVRTSDCGQLWHIGLQHETGNGEFNWMPLSYCMFPSQWRRMLRDEGRQLMGGGMVEPSEPWPRGVPASSKPRDWQRLLSVANYVESNGWHGFGEAVRDAYKELTSGAEASDSETFPGQTPMVRKAQQ